MECGFSFCGVDITTIGLEYAPELEDTYVHKAAKPRIHEETYDGHHGGYYYGMSREPKEFILKCYFEEQEIDQGVMARVYDLFAEGRSGKLIFSRRPWCWYYATVTELDTTGITNYMNGVIKIIMKAYYPFARSDMLVVNHQHKDYYRIIANTAFFEYKDMIPPTEFCLEEPMTKKAEFLLANPGNEYAPVGIEIAGDVGKGVVITNHTTGEHASFVAMSEAEFDGVDNYVYLDGMNGKTITVKDGKKTTNFLYHDEGFISLAPGFPARREIQAVIFDHKLIVFNKLYDRHRGDTRELTEEELKGKSIWIDGKWREITEVGKRYQWDYATKETKDFYMDHNMMVDSRALDEDIKTYNESLAEFRNSLIENEHRLTVKGDIPYSCAPETTMICQLNRITVEPVTDMKLTRLKFIYNPTFS